MALFRSQSKYKRISEQFLCGVPLPHFNFMNVIDDLADGTYGTANQDELLQLTSLHPLLQQYPPKVLYQQIFLKTIVKELEKRGAEISDKLYNQYCAFLCDKGEPEDWRFRIYTLQGLDEPYQQIVLRESDSLISNGTTGLRSWQATEDLVNWCAENSSLVENQRVLELGSGPGLGGLSIIALCQPKTFYFSDGHLHVLQLLKDNVLLNAKRWQNSPQGEQSKSSSSFLRGRTLVSTDLKKTSASVLDLPWEKITQQNFEGDLPFDIVVASDIVYDASIFGALSSAMVFLAEGGCDIVLACAERNPETLGKFIELLDSLNLVVRAQDLVKKPVLSFTNSPLSKIYLITKRSS